ncbi:LacI family DNA-binding transcriptional regulator [Streptomyces sp. NPDC059853]|uniref:LacI family DNA-binding transcriptional regulator n=1 Tax=Streptomyces sp. NPDC059853 TaxID=3346973 RepID=UPI0036558237
MSVTLADVAARAGVSAATVSRVLNGNYPVAGSTRSRVLRAVDELEYVVNGPASALAAATSDLVGVLVNDIADPFFGVMASAIQSQIGPAGDHEAEPPHGQKMAIICNTGGSPERELTYLTQLLRQRGHAVVHTGGTVVDPALRGALSWRRRRLEAGGTRVVLCGRQPLAAPSGGGAQGAAHGPEEDPGPAPVALTFDNFGGARRLTTHLLDLGHQRIGYLAGPAARTTTRQRLDGHRAALAAAGHPGGTAGAPEAERLTVHGGYDRASGYDGALELLRREPGLTAVVAANDTVALGACAALRERGLRIPEDISVAGFDDLPFAIDAAPALTTVRIPLHEAGARAGRLALGREEAPAGRMATLPADLMVRASTAPPRR